MPGQELGLRRRRVVDYEDLYVSVTVNAGATGTIVGGKVDPLTGLCSAFRLKQGYDAELVALGNAVSAGGVGFITYHLLENGRTRYPFHSFTNQVSDPANTEATLPSPVTLCQQGELSMTADNSDGANAYTVTTRLRVYYYDPLESH